MDRAQSSAIGFVVIFGTVLLMVGLVSVSGYAALDGARDAERLTNGVRSFEVLSTNVDDVVSEDVPSRSTTVKLADVNLGFTANTTIDVTVSGEPTQTYEVRPLAFDPGTGSRVVYENGAVIREDRDSAVMATTPELVVTNDYAVVPIVQTRADGATSVGGQTRASVLTTRNGTAVTSVSGTTVEITVTSPRSEVWYEYLDSQSSTSCTQSGDTVSCTLSSDEITIVVTTVEVTLTA